MNNENIKDFYQEFLSSHKKKYLFGINQFADAIASIVEIDGYIDQYRNEEKYNGKPIIKLEDVPRDGMVVSTVTNSRPKTALEKISAAGIIDYLDYFSFAEASNGRIPQLSCITKMRHDYKKNINEYHWVNALMADTESRQVFNDIIEFRLKASISTLSKYSFCVDRQYFEPFLDLQEGEVFVDGGGFDGFTTLEFARRCPSYKTVHFFEPSKINISLAQKNLANLHSINFYLLGLFDSATSLSFDSSDGSACRISEDGNETILVDALDQVVNEKVSFIKLDLEGAEMASLRGMQQHIINDHPRIAIAVYHHPSDIREIPRFIFSLRDDYKVYLRHYTEGWAETIMFFIPKL